jgi:hypothetical protein
MTALRKRGDFPFLESPFCRQETESSFIAAVRSNSKPDAAFIAVFACG